MASASELRSLTLIRKVYLYTYIGCCATKGAVGTYTQQQQDVELDHFYLLRVIGKGAFGKVRLVQHKGTGQQYALKCISKSRCVELRSATNMIAERRLLERIEYPLIVNLRYAFQDENYLFMVLDLMLGGDLRFHLDRNGPLTEMQVRFYVAEIALSLGYLHKRRIVHR